PSNPVPARTSNQNVAPLVTPQHSPATTSSVPKTPVPVPVSSAVPKPFAAEINPPRPVAKAREPIIVQSNPSQAASPAPVEETVEAPALNASGSATASGDKALSQIAGRSSATIPKATMRVSQGVSEGLLIKK